LSLDDKRVISWLEKIDQQKQLEIKCKALALSLSLSTMLCLQNFCNIFMGSSVETYLVSG
jgi:hypothetical protein